MYESDGESYPLVRGTRKTALGSRVAFSVDECETALRDFGNDRAQYSNGSDHRTYRSGLQKHQCTRYTQSWLVRASWALRRQSHCSCSHWCCGVLSGQTNDRARVGAIQLCQKDRKVCRWVCFENSND